MEGVGLRRAWNYHLLDIYNTSRLDRMKETILPSKQLLPFIPHATSTTFPSLPYSLICHHPNKLARMG